MDSHLSFYEIDKHLFKEGKSVTYTKESPMFVNLSKLPEHLEIKPLHMQKVDDAIGWVEITDQLMLTCCMDGIITIYQIKDVETTQQPEGNGEQESKANNPSNGVTNSGYQPDSPALKNSYDSIVVARERLSDDNIENNSVKSKPIEYKSSLMSKNKRKDDDSADKLNN